MNVSYLGKYNEIIDYRRKHPLPSEVYGENHHVRPRSIFPELVNDQENVVRLTAAEHFKCHYYLMLIYDTPEEMNSHYKMVTAFQYMASRLLGYTLPKYEISEDELDEMAKLFESQRIAMSEAFREMSMGENNNFYGKCHSEKTKQIIGEKSRNRSPESNRKISEKAKGRHPSEETRRKISMANKGKRLPPETYKRIAEKTRGRHVSDETKRAIGLSKVGKRWFTNGTVNVFRKECPDGFTNGKVQKSPDIPKEVSERLSQLRKRCSWFNNGEIEVYRETCPEGFVPGMIKGIMKWFNNGVVSVRDSECPEGFVPGRLMSRGLKERIIKSSRERAGRYHWFTNGVTEVFAEICPAGFHQGHRSLQN